MTRFFSANRCVSVITLGLAGALSMASLAPTQPVAQAAPSRSPLVQRSPARPMLSAVARSRILAFAARDLGRSAQTLTIREVASTTWSDSCLGLGGPAEICAQAQVPGWWVEIGEHNGWGPPSWFYRADRSGSVVRRAPQAQSLSPAVEQRLLAEAARMLRRPRQSLQITDLVRKTWDGCLGIAPGAEGACTAIALDGWQATLSDGARSHVFHLDRTASQIRHNERASNTTARIAPVATAVTPLARGEQLVLEIQGGLAGRQERITVMEDGRVFRRNGNQPVQLIGRLPHNPSLSTGSYAMWDLAGLAYGPTSPVADDRLITVIGRFGAVQYAETVWNQLPPTLTQLIQDWNRATTSLGLGIIP